MGWLGKGKVQNIDKQLSVWLAIAITAQFVLGLINIIGFISIGAFNPRVHPEHIVYGLAATGLIHAIPMRKDARPDNARFRTGLILLGVALILIFLSVARLPGGWSR